MSNPQPARRDDGDHDRIVDEWRRNAESHDQENYEFLRSMKFRKYGFEPDELAAELHQRAFEIIDCTRCANCCKTTTPRLNQSDIERISKSLQMTSESFIAAYLIPDEDKRDAYVMNRRPCPLLGDDDRCTIYDVRPEVCREYPHTDKEDFTTRTMGHSARALTCPAVFWIIEQMKQRARRKKSQRRRFRR